MHPFDLLGGEQIPRFASLTWSGNHQPELAIKLGMLHRKGHNPNQLPAMSMGIPDLPLTPRSLSSGYLSRFAQVPFLALPSL
jgi:hypothetical protein